MKARWALAMGALHYAHLAVAHVRAHGPCEKVLAPGEGPTGGPGTLGFLGYYMYRIFFSFFLFFIFSLTFRVGFLPSEGHIVTFRYSLQPSAP